jgi:hypothetical protein
VLGLTTALSRTGTPDADKMASLEKLERLALQSDWVIHCDTPQPEPTELEKAIVLLEEAAQVTVEAPVEDNPEDVAEEPVEEPKEPEINREELIANIKDLLEQREKVCTRNTLLQNKLGDHFKRKRVILSKPG